MSVSLIVLFPFDFPSPCTQSCFSLLTRFQSSALVLDYCLASTLGTVDLPVVLTSTCPLDFPYVPPVFLVARLPFIFVFCFVFSLLFRQQIE